MRAVVVHEPGNPAAVVVEDVSEPVPAPHEVVVRVAACGVCGHDQADRLGLTSIDFPIILGHEISGTIEALGSQISDLQVGDRVAAKQFTTCGSCGPCTSGRELDCRSRRFNYGGYAQYVALAASSLIHVPDNVNLLGASIVACAIGTTLQALRDVAEIREGECVVVTGAGGGLGVHGLQVARSLGATAIALTRVEAKRADLERYADHVVVIRDREFWREIFDVTDGAGADVVLDNVGHPAVFSPAFRSLRKRGRYVFTGQVAREKVELYPYFLFQREVSLRGSSSTLLSTFRDSMDLVSKGLVTPVVSSYPMDEAGAVFRKTDEQTVLGRAVLVP